MSLEIRRVVTGHDEGGRATVQIDEIAQNVESKRQGHQSCVIWSTRGFPVDNSSDGDAERTGLPTSLDDGTVFRVLRLEPGVAPRMHRTNSIDYAVVVSGQIDMELDDSTTVTLRAGNVVVQRGTMHCWVNRGPDPCVIAFVLVGAQPVTIDGRTLAAEG